MKGKKNWQNAGKGHTELLDIANALEHTRVANIAV
jgi:hypothetical protein